MKLPIKGQARARSTLIAGVLAAALFYPRVASATDLTFGNPAVSGDGSPGTTALFTNVASQDGVSIDMLATVIDATPGKVASFSSINGGDFRFDIGNNSGDRYFKVRYQFFENGTTTLRAIDDMAWSIGDLDKTTSRTESVVVQGASGFLAEDATTLAISQSSYTITSVGTVDLDEDDPDGNPEGVISFLFKNRAVLEITYQVAGGGGGYFDHVGDGAFPFYSPQQTLMGVYYTFEIVNDEEVPVKMDFENTLPEGFAWDTEYEPVLGGVLAGLTDGNGAEFALRADLEFLDADETVQFKDVSIPPGTAIFTLKTQPTTVTGDFENEAMTVPSRYSGFPMIEMLSQSTVTIPDTGPVPPEGPVGTLVETFKANFCSYALFQIGGEAKASGSAAVAGDVAVAPGASLGINPDNIGGEVVTHNPPSVNLTQSMTAAVGMAEDFAALTATQTFGTIGSDLTINGGAEGGVNVIAIDQISLSSGATLTFSGDSDDWFIINVGSKFSLSGDSRISLSGIPPSKILFNVSAGVNKVTLSGSSGALGMTILAPYSQVSLSSTSNIIGSVIAGNDTTMSGNGRISGLANFGGGCD